MRDSNNKALIHTDGCGYISKNLATLIQDTVIKGVKRPEKADPKYKQVHQKADYTTDRRSLNLLF